MKHFILALVLLASSTSFGFTLSSSTSSNFKGWSNPEISFAYNSANCPAGVDVSSIISDAFAVWNNVPTSRVHLSLAGNTTGTTAANPIPIICDPAYGNGNQGLADGSPGAAQVFPSSGDEITSGIMYLNASSGRANIKNLSRDIVALVLAHEIGHLLGLAHSQDLNALMYYNAGAKTTLSLAQDDIDGVSYLYPRNELGGDKPLGCALVKPLTPPGPGSFGPMLLLLLCPIAVALWLRGSRAYSSASVHN